MKRFAMILATALILLAMAACGSGLSSSGHNAGIGETPVPTEVQTPAELTPEDKIGDAGKEDASSPVDDSWRQYITNSALLSLIDAAISQGYSVATSTSTQVYLPELLDDATEEELRFQGKPYEERPTRQVISWIRLIYRPTNACIILSGDDTQYHRTAEKYYHPDYCDRSAVSYGNITKKDNGTSTDCYVFEDSVPCDGIEYCERGWAPHSVNDYPARFLEKVQQLLPSFKDGKQAKLG